MNPTRQGTPPASIGWTVPSGRAECAGHDRPPFPHRNPTA